MPSGVGSPDRTPWRKRPSRSTAARAVAWGSSRTAAPAAERRSNARRFSMGASLHPLAQPGDGTPSDVTAATAVQRRRRSFGGMSAAPGSAFELAAEVQLRPHLWWSRALTVVQHPQRRCTSLSPSRRRRSLSPRSRPRPLRRRGARPPPSPTRQSNPIAQGAFGGSVLTGWLEPTAVAVQAPRPARRRSPPPTRSRRSGPPAWTRTATRSSSPCAGTSRSSASGRRSSPPTARAAPPARSPQHRTRPARPAARRSRRTGPRSPAGRGTTPRAGARRSAIRRPGQAALRRAADGLAARARRGPAASRARSSTSPPATAAAAR